MSKQTAGEEGQSALEALFERLDGLIASEDHKAAIRTCDESECRIDEWRRCDLTLMHLQSWLFLPKTEMPSIAS
jgi:hypothetical protein